LEIKLKQRVIGIVVLGALAIILIPLLFKGYNQASNQPNIIQQIPAAPPPPVAPNTQTLKPQNTQTLANNNPPGVVTSKNQVVSSDNSATPAPMAVATSPVTSAAPTNTKISSAQVNKLNSLNKQLSNDSSASSALPKSKTVSKKTAVTASKSPTNSNTKSGNYAIQVGTFSNAKNAEKLVQQLRSHNLSAYTAQVTTSKGKMTRVLVGPLKDQATSSKALAQLQKLNIKGNIVSPGQTSSVAIKNSKKPGGIVSSNADN